MVMNGDNMMMNGDNMVILPSGDVSHSYGEWLFTTFLQLGYLLNSDFP